MKKFICLFLSLIFIVMSVVSCQGNEDVPSSTDVTSNSKIEIPKAKIDYDLTKMSDTLAYSQLYNILISPDSYLEKTMKLKGEFQIYQDPDTKKIYYACILIDNTLCCSQSIEFVLDGDYVYPNDYPALGSQIEVSGIIDTYYEGQYQYTQLIGAKLS